MSIDLHPAELRMVRAVDGLDLDLELLQGLWTAEQYLLLSNQTNRLLEFVDGEIEVLSMPTQKHQAISLFLLLALLAFIRPRNGIVLYAPLRLEIRPDKFREPDLLLLLDKHDPRAQDAYWLGADLVVEIVSPDNPQRDLEEKPRDYAEAGIPECWIVNPINETITVLVLEADAYTTHSVCGRGTQASSRLLPGFEVDVTHVFDAT